MIMYFAPTADSNLKNQERIDLLKKSLSQTLTLFYPLAGRLKENLFIECNDEGVDFVEARVNCPLLDILRRPEADDLDQFLPKEYHVPELASSLESQVAVQINIFSCGGMAIGTCISHKLVDGITHTSLINLWASMARGSDKYLSPIFVGSHLFPPQEIYLGYCRRLTYPSPKPLLKDLCLISRRSLLSEKEYLAIQVLVISLVVLK